MKKTITVTFTLYIKNFKQFFEKLLNLIYDNGAILNTFVINDDDE